MADAGFNGSTIDFGGNVLHLRSIRHSSSAAKADLTGSADAIKTYAAGLLDCEVTFDVVGTTALVIGDDYDVDIEWNDGIDYHDGSETGVGATNVWIVTGVEVSGDMDGEITSSITCVPNIYDLT